MEAIRLRVKDLDFENNLINVYDGKRINEKSIVNLAGVIAWRFKNANTKSEKFT